MQRGKPRCDADADGRAHPHGHTTRAAFADADRHPDADEHPGAAAEALSRIYAAISEKIPCP